MQSGSFLLIYLLGTTDWVADLIFAVFLFARVDKSCSTLAIDGAGTDTGIGIAVVFDVSVFTGFWKD